MLTEVNTEVSVGEVIYLGFDFKSSQQQGKWIRLMAQIDRMLVITKLVEGYMGILHAVFLLCIQEYFHKNF